jgi:FKBP-type peptidyl-prolyl cis-trans isomerase SlyD
MELFRLILFCKETQMSKRNLWLTVATLMCLLIVASTGSAQIKEGDLVTFEYTLTDHKGAQLDSSKGKDPLTYQHGKGNIIPGLEKQLTGMKPGQKKTVRVTPDEAYGPVNPEHVQEVPKDKLPKQDLKVGDRFVAQDSQGQRRVVTVSQVKDKTVIVDLNHPLAGKTLIFDIKVVDVKPGK